MWYDVLTACIVEDEAEDKSWLAAAIVVPLVVVGVGVAAAIYLYKRNMTRKRVVIQ